MTIIVNGENCDITLENEKNVGQVYDGLHNWLSNEGLAISEVFLDSTAIDLNQNEWRDSELEKIKEMEVVAHTAFTIHVKKLEIIKEYMLHLRDFFKSNVSPETLIEYLKDYDFIISTIYETMPGLGNTKLQVSIILEEHKVFETGKISEEVLPQLLYSLEALILVAEEHLQEIRIPEQVLDGTLEALKKFVDDPSMVSMMLQNGKDGQAMQQMVQVSDLLQKLFRIHSIMNAKHIESKIDLKSATESISPLLQELEEAFNNEDFVLIGDLLEYEVAPVLEVLLK